MSTVVFESSLTMRCGGCRRPFEAMTASLCNCVSRRPSATCPFCGTCVCKWPKPKALQFWMRAPQFLVDRSRLERERRLQRGRSRQHVHSPMPSILIVDDDEEIRAITSYALQQVGYAVRTALNAVEAKNECAKARADLVLTDALMPKLDGRELCRQLKESDPTVKVVIMTSLYTAPRYRTEAYRDFGADAYLAKPIDFEKLQAVLQKLLAPPMEVPR